MQLALTLQALGGLTAFCALAWLLSERRGAVRLRPILAGIALQVVLALVLVRLPPVRVLFVALNGLVLALDQATAVGTSFVFGYLGGGAPPFRVSDAGATFILAFRALPLVLVVSALSAVLYHWRILPWVVRGFAWGLERALGRTPAGYPVLGGAAGLGAAANLFVGMIEAPLLIRPYLLAMSRSELFTVMTCGMATIAGTVMVLYATVLGGVLPDALGQILAASLISVPAAVVIAGILVPPTGPPTAGTLAQPWRTHSTMDALVRGTAEGVTLLMHIVAMLVVLVAVVALVNMGLALLPEAGGAPLTLQRLLGWVMAPVVWGMGIPWSEATTAGSLMGTKTVLNELLAYLELARLPAGALSERSKLIMVYALCGFANPGSLGIMLGGLGHLVPERHAEIVALGPKSILAGTLATLMTGAIVGLV